MDYLSVYAYGKFVRLSMNHLENFVFYGKPVSLNYWKEIKRLPIFQLIVQIAKEYNGEEVIDKIIGDMDKSKGLYITDQSLVEETKAFKFFSKVFGIKKNIGSYTLDLTMGIFPQSIFGPRPDFLGIWTRTPVNLSVGMKTDQIKVKTKAGLEKAVKNRIIESIKDGYYNDLKRMDENTKQFKLSKKFEKAAIDLINSHKNNDSNSSAEEGLKKSIIELFEEIKNENLITFSSLISQLEKSDSPIAIDIVNKYKSEMGRTLKGGRMLRGLGIE